MKKKNSIVTLVALVAILVLGVGYAVITGVDLSTNGNVAAKSETLKVYFSGATPTTKTNGVTASIGSGTAPLTATIDVEDLELNVPKTATYTIKSDETDVDATVTLSSASVATNSTYYTVTTDLGSGKTLTAGGTLDVVVTVTLVKTPVTEDQSKDVATVTIHAEPINN